MNNKKQLFENVGGNSFRIATPQAMGMMQEETPGSSAAANSLGGEANVNAFLNKKPQPFQNNVRLTISRKPETNEWLVKVYVNGKYSEDKTYYTDDKQDAIDTAKTMMGDFQKNGLILVGKDGQPIIQEDGNVGTSRNGKEIGMEILNVIESIGGEGIEVDDSTIVAITKIKALANELITQ